MTKDADVKATPSAPAPKAATKKKPVIFTIIGRQRVGKTTLLNALAQTVHDQGGTPEIWNTDLLNRSHSISNFHDADSPAAGDTKRQRKWLEEKIQSLMESRHDAILDIGGGWTALHELINTESLSRALDMMGITLSVVFLIGHERADLDYLEDLQKKKKFSPRNSAIIINEGLIPPSLDQDDVVDVVSHHPAVEEAMENGADIFMYPAAEPMKDVCDRGMTFSAYAAGEQKEGFPTSSIFDRLAMDRWYRRDFPAFLQELGASRLPNMPKGLPVPAESDV
ncbi:FAD-binding oxidoreductase [Gluconobacter sp. Dm-44]|uniref:FAD-binding oxidoreductase n=1 Tax=Gluconobacter sp. Dm-44 TaxID=2799805 RepID=UPI001B8D4245|nr:FAD-binding oxidoreductase [Gluconobacter sp. Dm-44]